MRKIGNRKYFLFSRYFHLEGLVVFMYKHLFILHGPKCIAQICGQHVVTHTGFDLTLYSFGQICEQHCDA